MTVHLITIPLSPPFPESGMVTAVVRMTGRDRNNLGVAAQNMGLTQATLMRLLLVKGTDAILSELGIKMEYEQNENVDLSKGETLIE